jgi:hypothetical protein
MLQVSVRPLSLPYELLFLCNTTMMETWMALHMEMMYVVVLVLVDDHL